MQDLGTIKTFPEKHLSENQQQIFEKLKLLGVKPEKAIYEMLQNHSPSTLDMALKDFDCICKSKKKAGSAISNKGWYFRKILPIPGKTYEPSQFREAAQKTINKQQKKHQNENEKLTVQKLLADFEKDLEMKTDMAMNDHPDKRSIQQEFIMTKINKSQTLKKLFRQEWLKNRIVKANFAAFIRSYLLNKDDLDFIQFAKKRGYCVKKDCFDNYILMRGKKESY